ncbi:MAG TPA: efflux RND transporter periplasmic adaptor subunit [Pirellulaceae bacterium]
MKRLLGWLLVLLVLGGIVALVTPRARAYWKERNRPKFRTEKVLRGPIRWEVRTTGTVQPVRKVTIGAFVSGPIKKLNADFNQWVEKGELLVEIDPTLYVAAMQQSKAALATAQAEVKRVEATLQQARNDQRRALELYKINPDYISDSEMDQFKFAREALEAQLIVAQQSVEQSRGSLENSKANLNYATIFAPESGFIIDRKIDSGQTVVAQFQTPELFILAPEMKERMWVHASVVEADIGHIIRARKEDRAVEFTVDAYEDDLFHGKIREVRQNPTTDQNVVTYPVIVETSNTDLKLLPGMTASLSFEIDRREDVVLIPGAAIRYLPEKEHVRKADHDLLEGTVKEQEVVSSRSAVDRVEANRKRRRRHVWVQEDEGLRAIEVEFGISDGKYYELKEGKLTPGMELVTGLETKK